MKIGTRFTAIFISLTTLFALFTGNTYAQNYGSVYVDETTLVIEDGNVISGDKSLIDRGIIVIGDESDTPSDGFESREVAHDGKQPIKNNSALVYHDVSIGSSDVGVSFFNETPTAVNPDSPIESAKAALILNVSTANTVHTNHNSAATWGPNTYDAVVMHNVCYIPTTSSNEKTMTVNAAIMARGNCPNDPSTAPSYYINTMTGPIFHVKSGGTLNLSNNGSKNGGRVTLEGQRLYHTVNGPDVRGQWIYAVNWAAVKMDPLVIVEGGVANISETTFQNGYSSGNGSGARVTGGTLNLTDCTFVDCESASGGAISIGANGKAVLKNCVIDNCVATDNGGGIYVASGGELTIENTTIKNCDAAHGGAIYLAGSCTITLNSVTIQNNVVSGNGGALWVGNGVTVNHTGGTISGNKAEDGIGGAVAIARPGTYNLKGGTLSGNIAKQGGAIGCYASNDVPGNSKFTMTSGTISGNEAKTVGSTTGQGGALYIRCGAEHSISGGTITGNKAPQGAGIYVYNSTSYTSTVAGKITISGSANIYKNGNSSTTHGGGIYVGSGGTLAVSGGTIGGTSVSSHANEANAGGGICVAGGSATVTGGKISANKAFNNGGGIEISSGTVTISGGELKTNNANYGGAVHSTASCTLNISGGAISGNTVTNSGGAIAAGGGTVNISGNANINANTATSRGGGIYMNSSTVLNFTGGAIGGTSITSHANGAANGGGIYMEDSSTLKMSGSAKITCNKATGTSAKGGGLYVTGSAIINITGSTTVGDCAVSGNTADHQGGGFYVASYTTADNFKVNNITLNGNIAKGDRGGGIYVNLSTANESTKIRIDNAVFTENKSETDGGSVDGHGGGIYAAHCMLYITNSQFADNDATYRGAGVYCTSGSVAEVKGCSFTGNEVGSFGGGLHVYDNAQATIVNCSFDNNKAGVCGGALYAVGVNEKTANLYVVDTTIGTVAANTGGNGGGIAADTLSVVKIVRGNISNNEAASGGGIYAKGASTTVDISDNTNILGFSISGIAATGVGTVISGNKAATGNGGGVCFDICGNCSIINADIYGNAAPTNTPDDTNELAYITTSLTGNGGGVYIKGTKATLSGCTIGKSGQPNMAVQGGGVAIFKASEVTATNVNVVYNIAQTSGGGYCILGSGINDAGGATTFNILGGSISYNEAQSTIDDIDGNNYASEIGGGGLFIRTLSNYNNKAVSGTIDGVSINNNKSVRGGAIYQHESTTITLRNCQNVKENEATQLGGALFMTKSNCLTDIDDCVFTGNIAGLRGGALYIQVNGCTVNNVQMIGNKANGLSWGSGGHGGAIYITNAGDAAVDISLPLVNVDFTDNEAEYGGALCIANGVRPIAVTLSNSDFNDNTASKNGGAILVSGTGATVTVSEGYIINNTAGTTATTVSPYNLAHTDTDGVGGGIAVFNGGAFSLTGSNIAIYGNTAATAGNDVFANGNGTKLNIPAPDAMNTTGYGKDGAVWWEDYMTGDANYGYGLNGDSRVVGRYAITPISIRAYTTSAEGESSNSQYVNDAGQYVAITFDVQKYNVGSITITAPTATDDNQRFVFVIIGKPTVGDELRFSISLPAGESVTIEKLLPGTYTVTMSGEWSWRYTVSGVSLDGVDKTDGTGVVEVKIVGLDVEENYAVEYNANREHPYWLNYNSPIKTNTAGGEALTASFDMAEFKRTNVI